MEGQQRQGGNEGLPGQDSDDRGKMKDFPDDTKEYLLRAFPGYLYWLQNNFGSLQIMQFFLFTKKHDDFKGYIVIGFNPPIQ